MKCYLHMKESFHYCGGGDNDDVLKGNHKKILTNMTQFSLVAT